MGVCDFSRLAVLDWRLRRWRLWFLALMTATKRTHFLPLGFNLKLYQAKYMAPNLNQVHHAKNRRLDWFRGKKTLKKMFKFSQIPRE